jgi:hypothetical protein
MLKENQEGKIRYSKDKNGGIEVTERIIIPTSIPKANIKALDVSNLLEEDRNKMIELHKEYQQYFKTQMKTIFSFEDWIEASHPDDKMEVKYRTFKINNIEVL